MARNKFCFIFGSFLETMPNIRQDSDIDILCQNIDPYEARKLILSKYPNLPKNVKIDLNHAILQNGEIHIKTCYW